MHVISYRVLGHVLQVERKNTSASICYLSNINIFQYVTQYSTCTRQNSGSFSAECMCVACET